MFRGKTVIITGAGRGIGRQAALLMAQQGANVVVNDFGGGPHGGASGDSSVASKVVQEIKDKGGCAVAQCSSIGEWSGCQAVVECALENFGRIDYLINNAGIVRPKRIWDMDESDLDNVLDVCLKGCIGMVRYTAEHLKKTGGVVINISSSSGLGMLGVSNYGAAKEGMVGFTRCIARDLGEFGIRCYAVRPVTTDSNMVTPEVVETVQHCQKTYPHLPILGNHLPNDGGVEGSSAHVAAALAWLCTPHAEPINGREVYVHGGFISVYDEPGQALAATNPGGLSFDALCDSKAVKSLTFGQVNRYKKQIPNPADVYSSVTKEEKACCDDRSVTSTEDLTEDLTEWLDSTEHEYGAGVPDTVRDYEFGGAPTNSDYGYGDSQPDYGYEEPAQTPDCVYGNGGGPTDYGYGEGPAYDGYGYAQPEPDYGYGEEPAQKTPPAVRRPKRRCSVTKYSLDASAQVIKEASEASQIIEKFRNSQ